MAPKPSQKSQSQTQSSQQKPKASTRKKKTVTLEKKWPFVFSTHEIEEVRPTYRYASLWVDKYEPKIEAELAVHVRKVNDVRTWLNEAFGGGPSGRLSKYRRILTLTGPAGAGKTSTIRVLAREMEFEILEWRSSIGNSTTTSFDAPNTSTWSEQDSNMDYESLFAKFEAFLTRASSCQNVFASSSKSAVGATKRRVILLEDLPNILHQKTQAQLHEALNALVASPPSNPPVPVVIVISDAGMRGEAGDERLADGLGWGREKNQVVDVRTVLPKDLLGGPYVTEIGFNPIAPTLLRKALQAMLSTHFTSNSAANSVSPSKEVLDAIIESANGDIRSAIMALQFACIVEISGKKKKGKTMVVEAITRREQTLALFHLLGKVLYNKRKGDPPNSSATAKDLQKERDLDTSLKDLPKLPPHLIEHERRTSRVDVNMLYSDSPIDSSLFSLYIHQNYPQFCNEVDERWRSIARRSQKYFKPEFFGYLQKEKDAWEGVRATRDWVMENEFSGVDSGWRAGGWSKNEILLEFGGVLKAQDMLSIRSSQSSQMQRTRPPPIHRAFSRMELARGGTSGFSARQLNEGDVGDDGLGDPDILENDGADLVVFSPKPANEKEQAGGWLESDDIEDFD
ncbi:hypothetical protein NLJ89_g2894 [Agrocybe chaxingu]|uniref:Uncharacterized protein n=1 Tax=Agrocybe chaxingu TaxID=84603 RepID=A0A9W8K5Q6_9AGAR|nr:hypothetical protein NLJ89_g2894 [Agrocybe chaxingu]